MTDKREDAYKFEFDNRAEKNIMRLEIPLTVISQMDGEEANGAIIFMLGFFEKSKSDAIALVQMKRMQRMQSKLIVPGNVGPNGSTGIPGILKVH